MKKLSKKMQEIMFKKKKETNTSKKRNIRISLDKWRKGGHKTPW